MYENHHILKFADDTVIVSLLNSEEISRGPIDYFSNCCHESFLVLNVSKTKDMCIDFRRSHPSPVSIVIDSQNIEIVESC